MKLDSIKVFVVGNPPPGFGGRYFVFLKLVTSCGMCHGADLKGLGPVPGIAGRSPSYLVRQMYDMQAGARRGVWTPLMTKVVSQLSDDDMLEIAAYTASLKP